MKRKVHHPEPSERELNGPKYWRSLDELAATPGFKQHLEREFPEGASNLEGVDRRQFFKLMAASFALGGIGLAAGCRRPESLILPYGKSVEGIVPGLPLYFATAMPLRKSAIPLLAETHQGRPTKVEGNPSYKLHGGATSVIAQASILDLYDPDRATTHTAGGRATTVAAVHDKLAEISNTYGAAGGAGLAFLAEESSSPTRLGLVQRLKAKFPRAIWAEYEPVTEEPSASVAQAVFGANVKPLYRFAKAKRIVSIDADFLHAEGGSLYYTRDFSHGRRVASKDDEMNRLYVVESALTLTGGMADHRLRLASSHMVAFAAALATKLGAGGDLSRLTQGFDLNPQWIEACAADLTSHRGQSIVLAGAHLPDAVHAIVHAINAALGNVGQTVDLVEVPASGAASIQDLANAIKSGTVKTLVVLGGNPAYNAPADLEWAKLQKSVADVVRYGYYVDETSSVASAARMHIAGTHYLESWGDARAVDGTIVAIQPMILPLFGGLTDLEVLARIAGEATTDPYTLVYNTVTRLAGAADPADAFRKFLHDGLLERSEYRRVNATVRADGLARLVAAAPQAPKLSQTSLEVRYIRDYKLDDGRFANNGWLQELPDPITKIAWDNAILISPRLAKDLNLHPTGDALQITRVDLGSMQQGKEMGRIAEVTINGRTIRGPIHIQPGLSNYTIVLPLGYGRKGTGHVGKGQGFDVYPLRTSDAMGVATGATLRVTEELYALANTQEHWSMEGRDIVREANLDEYKTNPKFVEAIGLEAHSPPVLGEEGKRLPGETDEAYLARIHSRVPNTDRLPRGNSLYATPALGGLHQWGMDIDLNTCTGCNACVIACQAENNIPIVGKDQVMRGREMHWIRLDRYYSDGQTEGGAFGGPRNREIPEDPQVSLQPMACVHCELAPCETVCPVNATVHDEEGLNAMAYNRCIGTRYCANNCPYKVRRFNFFDWNKRSLDNLYMGPAGPSGMPELAKMAKNPDVTVRMRGVMEKCTYCVQRIWQAKIAQKVKARATDDVRVPDGAIVTACAQACPVDAIVFGDITDPNSAVSKAKARSQDYAVLGYLNTRPRTTYSARLRNPNPAMPNYDQIKTPYSRQELQSKSGGGHDSGHGGHGSHGGAGERHDDSHRTPPVEQKGHGGSHGAIQTLKSMGGLS